MVYSTTYSSPMGILTLTSNGDHLIGLWLSGQKYHGDSIFGKMEEKNVLPVFDTVKKWLDEYFTCKNPSIDDLPLAPAGSAFRKDVWDILCGIPYGEVTTYGNIAKKMADKMGKEKMSAQAVGGAVGHNPISIIIPCHRVVGSNGNLTGYGGGLKTKIKLLELEGLDLSKFFVPTKGTAL